MCNYNKQREAMWILLALLSGSCAAVLAMIVKLYLRHINPFFITFLFALITLVMLFVADLFTHEVKCKLVTTLTWSEWIPLIVAGCLNGFAFVCYLSALKCGKTGGVMAVDRLGIIFALVLSAVFLQETFTIKTMVGAVIMIIGAALISL